MGTAHHAAGENRPVIRRAAPYQPQNRWPGPMSHYVTLGNNAPIRELPGKTGEPLDWLAVGAVTCEPVSASNSLICREDTAIFLKLDSKRRIFRLNSSTISMVYGEIPYVPEQGFYPSDEGYFLRDLRIVVSVHFMHILFA